MRIESALVISTSLGLAAHTPAAPLPASCQQLVVAIANDWGSSTGKMQLFEKQGKTWQPVSAPFRVLFGKHGLAWGRGVAGQDEPGLQKREGDKRAPAGLFKLGTVYTYDPALPTGADYPFRQITEADAWIDDPAHPLYNRHVIVDPANLPSWFEKQKMRHNDPPHRWLVEIRHNADPPVPGAGSAIFFHIQRGPDRKSSGCTTMPQDAIVSLIRWLDAQKNPHYALLPAAEYPPRWKSWHLPPPESAATILK